MTRSSYIYIVEHPEDNRALAAFTVRHECVAWLKRMDQATRIDTWPVTRVRDGGFDPAGRLDAEARSPVTVYAREFVNS